MTTTETRITSSTGGQKGQKPQRMDLLPPEALLKISEVYHYGASKYDDNNWAKGYDWSLSYGAAQRHLNLFWSGQDLDEESGLPHLAHAAFHLMTLLVFMDEQRSFDDRRRPQPNLESVDLSEWMGIIDEAAKELAREALGEESFAGPPVRARTINTEPVAAEIAEVMNEAPEGTLFYDNEGDIWKRKGDVWLFYGGAEWAEVDLWRGLEECIEEEGYEFGVVGCSFDQFDWGLDRAGSSKVCPRVTLKGQFPGAFKRALNEEGESA